MNTSNVAVKSRALHLDIFLMTFGIKDDVGAMLEIKSNSAHNNTLAVKKINELHECGPTVWLCDVCF